MTTTSADPGTRRTTAHRKGLRDPLTYKFAEDIPEDDEKEVTP